ncbi:uncharacterized protein LOC101893211 isoform X1 [Musca domestica]|uniref:Uncharacterized protein LOC101893211 isoform X1 n=1 Tax=Musca domestica TaxID=7370 RepID=A0ABM3V0G0_MUSDO|nr:uncharacterized protein LOC101893211 isoform X1 [Musca domestica]
MPEANPKRNGPNDDHHQQQQLATTVAHTRALHSADSKIPKPKWNRSNSIDVTYIPLNERQNGDLYSNDECLNDHRRSSQNDVSSLKSSTQNCSYCCCSSSSSSSEPRSSCWHLKRRQIIRQSSHASAKNREDYIASRTEIAPLTTPATTTTTTTLSGKKSISLPATPNLSQLRRPILAASNYRLLHDERLQPGVLGDNDDNHMPLTYDQLRATEHQSPVNYPCRFVAAGGAFCNPSPRSLAHGGGGGSSDPHNNSMVVNQAGYYDNGTTTNPAHNNNNNNKAAMCANIVVVPTAPPSNNQTSPSSNRFDATKMRGNFNTKSQNPPPRPHGGGGGSGGFLRCEHCCERKNDGQNELALKHTSSYSAMYQPSDTETVSELSSYRFVTDEDLEIRNSKNYCSPSLDDDAAQRRRVRQTKLSQSLSSSNSVTSPSTSCVKNYDNRSREKNSDYLTNQHHELYTNHNNNNNNNNNYNNKNQNYRETEKREIEREFGCELRRSADEVDSETNNCCYSIDKSHSDKVIYYQAFAVTEPVQIPPSLVKKEQEDLLSSSLPRNYGSDVDGSSFARQLFLRQSLRSSRNPSGPPPVPPKPPTEDSSNESSSSYDPQRFYKKLQRFEKQNTVINQTLSRENLRANAERSLTPERCELLNCFPSYRNRGSLPRDKEVEYQNSHAPPEHFHEPPINGSHLGYPNDPLPSYNPPYTVATPSSPKRTLRYDHHGRLKSSYISQLPVGQQRRNSLETGEHSPIPQRAYSYTPIKLTPTLTRKFTYTPKHTITAELTEVNEDEYEINEKLQKNHENATISSLKKYENHYPLKQHSEVSNPKQSEVLNPQTSEYQKQTREKDITQEENNENLSENQNENRSENTSSPHRPTPLNINPNISQSPISPGQISYENTTSPPASRLLPPKKSHSSPLVLQTPSSPVWLSSETIASQTSSSQRCLDETQSNCSDQTTIFHFEPDNTSPSSSLLYGQHQQQVNGGGHTNNSSGGNNFLKGPLLIRRLPAIQSFGYIPTHSSSLGSANVREYIEKEITMEKRRNTLDRFQRLGFGRKSSPSTTNVSNKNSSATTTPTTAADSCGTSKQRKSSEKTERLRELTELLRVGGDKAGGGSAGRSSSPTPPPVPPPRKQRSSTPSSASTSFDKADASEKSSPSTSLLLAENSANNNNNNNGHSNCLSGSNRCSDNANNNNEPILSFMSTHSDDILLMDQDEPSKTSRPLRHLQKQISMESGVVLEEKGIEQLNVNNAKYSSLSASATPLASPTNLKSNASLSNLEVLLMKRESKSPPPSASGLLECLSEDESATAKASSKRSGLKAGKSKVTRTDSVGPISPKGMPFRSASFSQIDYSAGKYKKSALAALRDRLRRDKTVDGTSPSTSSSIFNSVVDSLTWPRKKLEEKSNDKVEEKESPPQTAEVEAAAAKKEPDWIYIPLKQKPDLSINLCYGQDKSLEDVMESPELIPEEEVFMADTIHELPEDNDKLEAASVITIQASHAKMESLTDTIQSDNDYVIDESQVPVTVEASNLAEAKSDCQDANSTPNSPTTEATPGNDGLAPNLATLMEEQIPLESPPDNFLQTATTCLIPVPVYECAAQEWGLENPPQEWEEVAPEEFIILPEPIEPLATLDQCNIEKPETKTDSETVPTISVRRSSDEMDDTELLRKKEESPDKSSKSDESECQDSKTDMDALNENRSSLDNIPTRHSSDDRRKADMSTRRKGIYIENWHEPSDAPDGTSHKSLALDISIANLNAIKPDSSEDDMMYINSPITDDNKTPASLYSFDLNTPDSEYRHSPVWSKNPMMSSFSCQSSEEKDDPPLASPPVSLSTSHISLPRQHKSFPFLRTDSVSDNESDRTPPPRDRNSPVSGDHDFKRFSKRPLRGPYGQMLEAEMKKPQKKHFEEILEELREDNGSLQPRRQRSTNDDAGGSRGSHNVLPHYSSSMRVRKIGTGNNHNNNNNGTSLPVPQHTRAASTPSQIENISGSRGSASGSKSDALDNDLRLIKPLEKKYQSTLDTTSIGRDDMLLTTTTTAAMVKGDAKSAATTSPTSKSKTSLLQREQKRAASESPTKTSHSKRSQSMSSGEKPSNHLQHVHQQKRSLDVTSTSKQHKAGAGGGGATSTATSTSTPTTAAAAASGGNATQILPTQELLAQLLKGSSEKLLSEQRQQMFADTRTHIVHEIFRNEQSYVESLQTMVNRYLKALKSPEHAGVIEARTVDEIFFMVPDILEIHEKFLAELRNRLDNWDAQQKVGDAFMETFSKLEVLEVYTSFVNNCSRAKNAIRTTKHQRPAFAKFLETTAREHKGKLTLDYLLIKPVQKFPNYELLFQRLIKHTDHDHPDHKHLQDVLKLVHDILVHINCKEREILENGQREATLRELEGVIEGITDLIAPDRQFLLFDLVTMPSGQGARKERGFFLFNDLLVLTSIKKRSGTIRKPNTTTCPGTVASTLDTNKYKFLTKISLDCLEIVKTKDENIKRIMTEIENLAEDCNKLQQISEITSSLKMPHQYLEDVIRELLRDAQRQLSERQTNDAQLNMLELAVNSPNGTQKLSIVFSKSEKRTQWEETFNEAKQKLAATLERHPIPEFLTSIPIRKTRAGLQFTCAAATLSEKRDVWVCNSDGYVGQVCIMSLHPEPNVTSCNGVCNARILCVASVPAYSPHSSSIKSTSSSNDEQSVSSSTTSSTLKQQHQQQHHHHHHQQQQQQQQRSSLPPLSYTQQLLDYRKSISPNYSNPSSLIGTPEKKRDKSQSNSLAGGGSSSSVAASTASGGGAGANNSDIQLDLNLSSSDEEAEAANAAAAASSGVNSSSGGVGNSHGSGICERVPSPAPSTHTTGSTSTASTAIVGSSSTLYHGHQDSNPDESDGNQSTMWIGTEDGCIHVYNSTDNIRIKKNRIKIEHHAAVYSILYLDNRVFVALANGDICVYLRDGAVWNTTSSHCLSIGTVTSPVTKLLNVHGRLWCSIQGIIKVLDIETLAVVNQIQISSDSKPITNMCVSSNYVWISIQNSAHIKCFHSNTHQLITEVNLAQAVNKMLSNCDEIIRQHKAACLRVTSLLSCRDLIWIGTSAGVLLTIPSQGYEKGAPNVVPTGIPHGHTGHVRFLTYVETTGATGSASSGESGKDHETNAGSKSPKPKGESAANSATSTPGNILIISGGDGYEDFRNSGANSLSEIAGREDSTNHLLIWQI